MATLGTQFFGKLRALGEGAVGVAVWVIRCVGLVVSAVGSVAALGCDLLQVILGKVREVGRVGGCHSG